MIKWYTAHPKIVGNKAKGRISKRVFRENKARQIFLKTNISYSLTRTRSLSIPLENINVLFLYPSGFLMFSGGIERERMRIRGYFRKSSFFGKFGVLCFLETPVLRSALLAYYQRNINWNFELLIKCYHKYIF